MCVHTCMHVCTRVHVSMRACVSVHVSLCASVHKCVCVHACMCLCVTSPKGEDFDSQDGIVFSQQPGAAIL